MSAGKGDTPRPVNKKKFDQNYDRIFSKKKSGFTVDECKLKCPECGANVQMSLEEFLKTSYNCETCHEATCDYDLCNVSCQLFEAFLRVYGKKAMFNEAKKQDKKNKGK
jgi:hypothetical protein